MGTTVVPTDGGNLKSETVPLVSLLPGDVVDQWTVTKTLGTGAFGAVFEVYNRAGKTCALKTESTQLKVRVLKMEVVVLYTLAKSKATHCCEIVDTGKFRDFVYIVMTLIGDSLGTLRKMYKESRFSMGCAISVSMQCLEAIQELHNAGYLHRDLKPGNFAVALDNPRRVIIFDFGMCRKFVGGKDRLRKPRTVVAFRGTLRYASLGCHDCQEQSRKDDLESWVYQTIELTSGYLPWSGSGDLDKVQEMKAAYRTKEKVRQLLGGCPKEYLYLLQYVDDLNYYELPKYSILRGLLRDALIVNQLQEFPYDWEKKKTKNSPNIPPIKTL